MDSNPVTPAKPLPPVPPTVVTATPLTQPPATVGAHPVTPGQEHIQVNRAGQPLRLREVKKTERKRLEPTSETLGELNRLAAKGRKAAEEKKKEEKANLLLKSLGLDPKAAERLQNANKQAVEAEVKAKKVSQDIIGKAKIEAEGLVELAKVEAKMKLQQMTLEHAKRIIASAQGG